MKSVPKKETEACIIWNLLRFNSDFEDDSNWFCERYKRIKSENEGHELIGALMSACNLKIDQINRYNPPAAIALQWMFPMPIFTRGNDDVKSEHIFSWGPYLATKNDDISKAWDEFELRDKKITLGTDWNEANPYFKQSFSEHIESFRRRPNDQLSRAFFGKTEAHETTILNDLEAKETTSSKSDSPADDLVNKIYLNDLKNHYHIIAIPKDLSRGELSLEMEKLKTGLNRNKPFKQSSMFGSETQWKDFLEIRKILDDGKITAIKRAIHEVICIHHNVNYSNKTDFREACRTYESRISSNFGAIQKLIDNIYKKLPL